MPLPKFEYPEYTLKLPSSGQEIKFRPFIVKEQKNLMTALELKDEQTIINTLCGIVDACTFNKLDINSLPAIDIEYIFLQLKAKSTSDIIPITYICENEVEKDIPYETINPDTNETITEYKKEIHQCGNKIKGSVNLLNIEVEKPSVSNIIRLNPVMGMKLRFPTFGTYRKHSKIFSEDIVDLHSLVYECIEYIFSGDDILKPEEDFTRDECLDFFDQLTPESLEDIINFFNNIPRLKYSIKLKCSKCGHEETIPLEGIQDFLV